MSMCADSVTVTMVTLSLSSQGSGDVVLDLLVENAGRVNYGYPLEGRKGKKGRGWSLNLRSYDVWYCHGNRYPW